MAANKTPRTGAWACLDRPGGCACNCHTYRDKPMAPFKSKASRGAAWTDDQDFYLGTLLEDHALEEVAAKMNTRFGTNRTVDAIQQRVSKLGLSARPAGMLSKNDVEAMLGMSPRKSARLIVSGILPLRRVTKANGQPLRWYMITMAELEAFVDEWAGVEFRPETVAHPGLRARAEVAARANVLKGYRSRNGKFVRAS